MRKSRADVLRALTCCSKLVLSNCVVEIKLDLLDVLINWKGSKFE